MNKSELIQKYLKNANIVQKKSKNRVGCTTIEISNALNISRANVSTVLNKLHREGIIEKTDTRPIHYYFILNEDNLQEISLDNFLTNYDRNSVMITRAKTAMTHPPHGLDVCLVGEVGVGKLFFAKLMHNYAKEEGTLNKDAPFITVDCTKYLYNNKKLLLDLFGISSVDNSIDKNSLIFKAKGGIIFLEEPHLLSKWFHNVLFQFMRRGFITNYEKEFRNIANVKFICACVGNKSNYYIRSFSDLFPISIELPELKSIALEDRLSYINLFFQLEAEKMASEIVVDTDVVECFLLYNCMGNLAQLHQDIRTTCSYSPFETNLGNRLEIRIDDLDPRIKQGLYNYKANQNQIDLLLQDRESLTYATGYSSSPLEYYITHNKSSVEPTGFSELNHSTNTTSTAYKEVEIAKFVGKKTLEIAKVFIKTAQKELDRKYSQRILFGLCMHLDVALNYKIKKRSSSLADSTYVKKRMRLEYNLVTKICKHLYEKYNITIDKEDYTYIALYLSNQYNEEVYNNLVPPIIIAMHGYSVAGSMVETIKQLLHVENIHAHDIHLDKSFDIIYQELKQLVKSTNYNKGILILTDLESNSNFTNLIRDELDITIKMVTNISTALALEYACRIDQFREISKAMLFVENKYLDVEHEKENIIIVACYSKKGNTQVMKEYLEQNLSKKFRIKIIAATLINSDEFKYFVSNYQKEHNVLVVSNFEDEFSFVKNIPYDEITKQNGINKIYDHFSKEEVSPIIDHSKEFIYNDVFNHLETNYQSVNIIKLRELLTNFLNSIEVIYNTEIHCDIGIGLICHMCATIDYILNNSSTYELLIDNTVTIDEEKLEQLKSLYIPIEDAFEIKFNENEPKIVASIMADSITLD